MAIAFAPSTGMRRIAFWKPAESIRAQRQSRLEAGEYGAGWAWYAAVLGTTEGTVACYGGTAPPPGRVAGRAASLNGCPAPASPAGARCLGPRGSLSRSGIWDPGAVASPRRAVHSGRAWLRCRLSLPPMKPTAAMLRGISFVWLVSG